MQGRVRAGDHADRAPRQLGRGECLRPRRHRQAFTSTKINDRILGSNALTKNLELAPVLVPQRQQPQPRQGRLQTVVSMQPGDPGRKPGRTARPQSRISSRT